MTESRIVGLDLTCDTLSSAEVEYGDGSPHILALVSSPLKSENSIPRTNGTVLAVPDTEYLVKSLDIPSGRPGDIVNRVQFELAQTMPEPWERFLFDHFPSHRPHQYHGIIFRRTFLSELTRRVFPHADPTLLFEGRFCARAIALGKGYLTFCRAHGGELVCIADFCGGLISLCLMYRGCIVAVGHVVVTVADSTDEIAMRRLAIRLKTIINVKLLAVAAEGVTVPISGFLLSGESISPQLLSILEQLFPVGLGRPEALIFSDVSNGADPIRYLVPLGLTVN